MRRYIDDGAFSPEVVAAMSVAFDDALNKLKLVDRDDPLVSRFGSSLHFAARSRANFRIKATLASI